MKNNRNVELSDEELMLLYQEGDELAFEQLYNRYSGRIYSYLSKRMREKNWVDDVFQMIFIKFHKTRHQYQPAYRFDQWIFIMTKTVLLDFWKTTDLKTKRYFSEPLDHHLVSEISNARPHVIQSTEFFSGPLMAEISDAQKTALKLKFFDELSYQEIANKLSRSEESVRQLISRAIRKMKTRFQKTNSKEGDGF